MKRIIILASGSGTNAENIIQYFQSSEIASVCKVLSNKKDAGVLLRAKKLGVPFESFSKEDFYSTPKVLETLKKHADYLILAGFLWKVPIEIIKEFKGRILNIHPSLLPKYGGKGMYGAHVHRAVLANKELESGITIHLVNEEYDEGAIVFQKILKINENEDEHSLANRIHELEYKHYPKVIEQLIKDDLQKSTSK